jgi:hypothetical protein
LITYVQVKDSDDKPVARITPCIIVQAELPLLGKAYFSVQFSQQGPRKGEHKDLVMPVIERALQRDTRCTFTGREGDIFITFISAPQGKQRTAIELDAYRQVVLSDMMSLVAAGLKEIYPYGVECSADVQHDTVPRGTGFWLDAPAQG